MNSEFSIVKVMCLAILALTDDDRICPTVAYILALPLVRNKQNKKSMRHCVIKVGVQTRLVYLVTPLSDGLQLDSFIRKKRMSELFRSKDGSAINIATIKRVMNKHPIKLTLLQHNTNEALRRHFNKAMPV